MSDRFIPTSKRREAVGGLKARSSRGDIGTSWWARRFIEVLESLAVGGRLARGRNYARVGQVVELDVAPGEVRATVQGSRPAPYQVRIGLAVFPEAVWAAVEETLAGQAIHRARLLAGEVPADLEDVFAAAGSPLFPRTSGELPMSCTCPDWAVPCKHLAAALYLLAEAFDADPFLLLRWRGRDRETLLRGLDTARLDTSGMATPDMPRERVQRPGGGGPTVVDVADPPDDPHRFWVAPVPLPSRPRALPGQPGLLLRQLRVPGPALGGDALVVALAEAYERFSTSH